MGNYYLTFEDLMAQNDLMMVLKMLLLFVNLITEEDFNFEMIFGFYL